MWMGYMGLIQKAWCRETSVDPEKWTPDNPAYGQCAVTALVIQDLLGGDLLRGTVNGVSHYWNRLPDGTEIDLTKSQFGGTVCRTDIPVIRPRSYLESFPETVARYELLRTRTFSV